MLRRTVATAVLAGVLALPAGAHADAFEDVFADYQKDERISACAHSEQDLESAKAKVPNDVEQYAPDFPAALDEALEERASKGCGSATQATTTTPAAAGAAPTPPATTAPATGAEQDPLGTTATPAPASTVPQPPGATQAAAPAADGAIVNAAARTPAKGADDTPPVLIAGAALIGLALLVLLVWGLARFFAWDPAWAAGARHAIAEAGWRTSGVWEDFTDWLRGGRARRS